MGSLRATSLEAFDEIDRVFNPLPQFVSLGEEVSTTMKAFQGLSPPTQTKQIPITFICTISSSLLRDGLHFEVVLCFSHMV
jgi:hypothetical protein